MEDGIRLVRVGIVEVQGGWNEKGNRELGRNPPQDPSRPIAQVEPVQGSRYCHENDQIWINDP